MSENFLKSLLMVQLKVHVSYCKGDSRKTVF
ncbi:hypothetical protein T03_6348 [Trichinella britovi]|uniref:Uncharacterized protein n=1 Tax=Trichinella britovi TaxID=45882 RepID=A0A0V0YYN2_TRIBR|nr:hypothetical protein T03_6348 [Trichinella britovi]